MSGAKAKLVLVHKAQAMHLTTADGHQCRYNERHVTDPEPTHRCYRCLRPQNLCYCNRMPSVPTATRVVILQHPHERTHPFGTARLARMCMPSASVHVPSPGYTGTLAKEVEVPEDAAVLFPHADADDLAEVPQAEWPSTLIAIDGTWSHAKRLYRENTWLHTRRHVRLQPTAPSNYRIRKEPKPEYISTIEAIVEALRIIEPGNQRLDELLQAFDLMIDQQIAHRSSRVSGRFKAARNRESRALSPQLRAESMVVVFAEAGRPGGDAAKDRELVHWVAARTDNEESFEAIIKPTAPPSDEHLRHLGITPEQLAAGCTPEEARQAFLKFVPDAAPIAAWTDTTLQWGAQMLPESFDQVLLKHNYCNTRQRSSGYLEDVVKREQLTPPELPCGGRAGARLRNALAVARWLQTQ